MPKRLLLTGASGFVGSHALRHVLTNTDWNIVCPVSFRHQGTPDRIASAMGMACFTHPECIGKGDWSKRVTTYHTDLRSPPTAASRHAYGRIDYVWNIAAESHVDRSIEEPSDFIRSNVELALAMVELVRQLEPEMMLHMSTDEVYGPAARGYQHVEWDTIRPSNPYSASKACQEAILYSAWRTYGIPLVITNTMNIIGEGQGAEKYVPMILRSLLLGETLTVHADLSGPEPVIGSRCWLHARNLADAWLWITQELEGAVQTYKDGHTDPLRLHIVGDERTNLEIAQMIAELVGVGLMYELVDFHGSRPGHDLRYALDGRLIAELGWKAPVDLESGISHVVRWMMGHPQLVAAN